MALSATTLSELQLMIVQDKILLACVQGAGDAGEGAALIAAAAGEKGIAVDRGELLTYLEECKREADDGVLDDDLLDGVAGGLSEYQYICASIVSIGIACIGMSLSKNSRKVDFATCNPG